MPWSHHGHVSDVIMTMKQWMHYLGNAIVISQTIVMSHTVLINKVVRFELQHNQPAVLTSINMSLYVDTG